MGGNSSCRLHVRVHYNLYKEKCQTTEIPVHHHAIPWDIWRNIVVKKEGKKIQVQQTLDMSLTKIIGPKEFTRDGILHAVAQHVVCDDQMSPRSIWLGYSRWWKRKLLAVADKATFCNCLVTMRPKTCVQELPSTHDVVTYIHNQFVNHLNELREFFKVQWTSEVKEKFNDSPSSA